MNQILRVVSVLAICAAVTACVASKLSTIPVSGRLAAPVKIIALDPGGGLLADAVSVELSNRGFTVLDSATTSRMMARLNINEVEISTSVGLEKLKAQGVDAYLTVRAAGGYDQQPQSASARVNSTSTGQVVAGITWQNGWGGQAGSMADRTMRKGLSEAAAEIAEALARSLNVK
jgi:hypothetical protein